jgi:hypothetical protein
MLSCTYQLMYKEIYDPIQKKLKTIAPNIRPSVLRLHRHLSRSCRHRFQHHVCSTESLHDGLFGLGRTGSCCPTEPGRGCVPDGPGVGESGA